MPSSPGFKTSLKLYLRLLAYLKAYRGRSGFRGDCSLQTWLLQISINLVRDFARSRRLQFWRGSQTSSWTWMRRAMPYRMATSRPKRERS